MSVQDNVTGAAGTAHTAYEYLGYLGTLLAAPDARACRAADGIEFTADDLAKWRTIDLPSTTEWEKVPSRKQRTGEGVRIQGDFKNILSIDSLSENDPRYWVPLSSVGQNDSRFPVDTATYPIVEITYRCTSDRAHPTWMWTYEGGSHFGALPKGNGWRTVARGLSHFGFPGRVTNVIVRLYSPTRTVESMEVASIRFRAMTPAEEEAVAKSQGCIEPRSPKRQYPLLDEFMPLGVYMDAESSKRLAAMLGISLAEYWELVMEDLVVHHHNAVALAHVHGLKADDWRSMLGLAEANGIRFVPRHEYPLGGTDAEQQRIIDTHIAPLAGSNAILAHMFSGEPLEDRFREVLAARDRIEAVDPNHPVALVARYPNAHPLFAPFFNVSGIGHFASRQPWDLGTMVRTHEQLGNAQQFWASAPAFVYPTETPEWSTSPEMRLMVNKAVANGARGWFAYSYHNDPAWLRGRVQRTLTGPFLTFSDLWMELMQRMRLLDVLAPLFLSARVEEHLDDWFVRGLASEYRDEPAPGIPPISLHHLKGPDFSMYMIVSNNVREMTGVNVDFAGPPHGLELYDVSAFVRTRKWGPMPRKGHIEMFPGQGQVMLVTQPQDGNHWRSVISSRLIRGITLKMKNYIKLVSAYGVDCEAIEEKMARAQDGADPANMDIIHGLKDRLVNMMYAMPQIAQARSQIIEASAAVCACDGALCRLMGQGKKDRARQLGIEVVPLAREFTSLRIELRKGNGAEIFDAGAALTNRARALLERIRAEYDR